MPETERSDRYPFGKGMCACGCGQKTKISKTTNKTRGLVKGEPLRFVHGHNNARIELLEKRRQDHVRLMSGLKYPLGLCQCGCGQQTSFAQYSNASRGHVKGQPLLYVFGHGCRMRFYDQKVDEAGNKQCAGCQEFKSPEEFFKAKKTLLGLSYYCKICDTQKVKNYVAENREKVQKRRRKERLAKEYGIDEATYQSILEAQEYRCAICGVPHGDSKQKRLRVDHCHDDTRIVRGLLCNGCNLGIGRFGDDPKLLRRAVEYLERHR